MQTENINQQVSRVIEEYPVAVQKRIFQLRDLVYEVAREEQINDLLETLKWGEPSYVTKKGSTLRMAWKAKSPEQFALYFNCKTTLVETIKELFGDVFRYEGNRALLFLVEDTLPVEKIRQCIRLSLTYHERKHLPLLGC